MGVKMFFSSEIIALFGSVSPPEIKGKTNKFTTQKKYFMNAPHQSSHYQHCFITRVTKPFGQ
jgi:hypothetical protein